MASKKRIHIAIAALVAMCLLQIPSSAFAAVTGIAISPSSVTPSATAVEYAFTTTGGWSATAIKCIKITVGDSAGAAQSGAAIGAAAIKAGSTGIGTVANWGTGTVSTNTETWTNSGTQAITAGTITFTGITNPSAQNASVYVRVDTYSGACGTGLVDSATAVFTTTNSTVVDVTVDPSLSFGVAGQTTSTVCNGLPAATVDTQAVSVPLGHVNTTTNRSIGVQQLQASTNAKNGYTVTMKSTSGTSPVLTGTSGNIPDATANSAPTAGTKFFGYSGSGVTSAMISPVPNSSGSATVMTAGAPTNGATGCVAYAVGIDASIPAGAYSTTVVYTMSGSF